MVSSIAIYCLPTVTWFQVLLSNTNNSYLSEFFRWGLMYSDGEVIIIKF